nr:hypothetical protein [Pandoravirus belohorizontensis]
MSVAGLFFRALYLFSTLCCTVVGGHDEKRLAVWLAPIGRQRRTIPPSAQTSGAWPLAWSRAKKQEGNTQAHALPARPPHTGALFSRYFFLVFFIVFFYAGWPPDGAPEAVRVHGGDANLRTHAQTKSTRADKKRGRKRKKEIGQ